MDLDSAFKILELEKTTDLSAIRRAYRDLAEIWHPDKYAHNPRLAEKAVAKMKEINCAYDVIQEHLRNNRSSFDESPSNETEEEELFDFVDCSNCGVTNRVSKNISGQTLKCGHCGKNPREQETQFENEHKSADSAGSFEENDAKSRTNKDSANTKNIQVLRPALIASLAGLIWGFATAKIPSGGSDNGSFLATSLAAGIILSVLAFAIVASWQGLRRYFGKPTAKAPSKKYKLGSFAPIVSEDDAFVVLKGNGWAIVILTGFSSVLEIDLGNYVSGLLGFVLVGGSVFTVWYWQSRIAAIGLMLLTFSGLFATGYNRFFGGEGGKNMVMSVFVVWASISIVLAIFRLHSLKDTPGEAILSDHHNEPDEKWAFLNIPVVLLVLIVGIVSLFAFSRPESGGDSFIQSKAQSNKQTYAPQYPTPVQIPKTLGAESVIGKQPDELDRILQADALNGQGDAYYDTKQYEKAIEVYQQAIQVEPDYALSWKNVGVAYRSFGQNAKAIEAFQYAIRLVPDYIEAWNGLGGAYAHSGKAAKAIETYQQAVHISPDYANTWNGLGVVYSDTGQTAKAIEAYQQAIRIKADYALAWYNLGVAYKNSGQTGKVTEVYNRLKTLNQVEADDFYLKVVNP